MIYILELLFQNVKFFPVWKRKKFQNVNFFPVWKRKKFQNVNFFPVWKRKKFQNVNFFPVWKRKKFQNVNFFPVWKRKKFQNVKFSQGKVPKCKLFSFTNWNFLFFQPCKIFPRPNSGDKKNEILHFGTFSKIWRRFLSQIIFFKNFFEMKYILKSFIP